MENIRFDALSFYDSILKSYAAENATVFISRKYTDYVSVLKDRLLVKKVIELTGGNTRNWDDITSIQGSGMLPARVGDTYAFRVTYGSNQNPASLTYNGINGEPVTTNIHTGNAIVCVAVANEALETDAKWLAVTDNVTEIVVNNNNPTLAWGQQSVIGSVQGTNLSVVMPANPAQNIVQQATYDSNNILEPISGSDGKKIRIPEIYVLTEDTTDSQNNPIPKGLWVRYWNSDGLEQRHNIADIDDFAALVDLTGQSERIAAIESKIPSEATAQNKLADKAFVNSSVATNTATHRGSYTLMELGLTDPETLPSVIGQAIATKVSLADNNDYVFVAIPISTSDTRIDHVDRYKYSVVNNVGTWGYEYTLNNSGFTAAQWESINSGMTSGLKDKLNALPTNADLTTALAGKVDKETGKGLSTNDYTTAEKTKLANAIIAETNATTSTVLKVKTLKESEYYALTSYDAYTEYIIIPNS